MTSLDDEFFETGAFRNNIEKLQALSKISRCRVDHGPSIPIPSPKGEMERVTGVTKDQVLPSDNGSAKYVQPTVIQKSEPTIASKPSGYDPALSRFTVRRNRTEFSAVTKNDSPNLYVSQEQEPETITEVEEIPSSQSTPLVPPLDVSKCSLRLDSHMDHRVGFVDSLIDPIPSHTSQMESFIPCVGCGEPLFGSPCSWCTCVRCGNDIRDGSCLFCGSRNSFYYDPNPNSFNDFSNFSNYPPQPDLYSLDQQNCCEYCGGPHFSSDCQTRNPFPCNNYDYSYQDQPPQYQITQTPQETQQDSYLKVLEVLKELKEELNATTLHNAPSISSAYCGGPHNDYQCQPSGFDKSPPPQFSFILNSHEKSMVELLTEEQVAKIDSYDAFEKAVRESIAKEKAARSSSQFRFISDDSDDEDSIQMKEYYKDSSRASVDIPPIQKSQGDKSMQELLAEEHMKNIESMCASLSYLPQSDLIAPEIHTHSLIMGDEHLDTIPAKESDVFIKSSVENLVPIPGESQGILDHVCDIPPPLVFPSDNVEMSSDSDDDDSLSCGDISYLEELPSELVSLEEENDEVTDTKIKDEALRATLLNVSLLISKIEAFKEKPISSPIPIKDSDIFSDDSIPEFEAFGFDQMGEKISGSTTSHSHNSLPDYESFTIEEFAGELTHINSEYDSFTFEEFSLELTHIISPPEYDNFYFDLDTPGICLDQLSLNDEIHDVMNSHVGDDELVKIFIMTFFLFFTYLVTSPLLRSFRSEDTVFDPGILIYHF